MPKLTKLLATASKMERSLKIAQFEEDESNEFQSSSEDLEDFKFSDLMEDASEFTEEFEGEGFEPEEFENETVPSTARLQEQARKLRIQIKVMENRRKSVPDKMYQDLERLEDKLQRMVPGLGDPARSLSTKNLREDEFDEEELNRVFEDEEDNDEELD